MKCPSCGYEEKYDAKGRLISRFFLSMMGCKEGRDPKFFKPRFWEGDAPDWWLVYTPHSGIEDFRTGARSWYTIGSWHVPLNFPEDRVSTRNLLSPPPGK